MRLKLIIYSLLIIATPALAQKTKEVRNVEGRCEISRHITLEQAEKRALQEAKQEALRKAGVAEEVWSVFGTITQEDGQAFKEIYSEMSVLAVGGLVNVTDKPVYSVLTDPNDNKQYAVAVINAKVKVEDKSDKSYKIDINGIASVYKDGELLNFTTTIYGCDSYLKIFWFDADGGSLFFPSSGYDEISLFTKGKSYQFPTNSLIEYVVSKIDKKRDSERINIMAIATKKDYPFLSKTVTFETLLKWIYDIPASERATYYEMVIVK